MISVLISFSVPVTSSMAGQGPGPSTTRTRHQSSCKMSVCVGAAKKFASAYVPTNRAVIQMGLQLKQEKALEGVTDAWYPIKEMAKDLVILIEAQWHKANCKFVPPLTISKRRMEDKILVLWNKVLGLAQGRGKASEKNKIEKSLDQLFDIVQCKHTIILCQEPLSFCSDAKCKLGAHLSKDCKCPKDQKVPVLDLQWLRSQRDKQEEMGGMQMSATDYVDTKKQNQAIENKAAREEAGRKKKRKLEVEDLELEDQIRAYEDEMEVEDDIEEGEVKEFQPPAASLTKEEKAEAKSVVNQLLQLRLEDKRPDTAQLVKRYLDMYRVPRNYMAVPAAAAASLR